MNIKEAVDYVIRLRILHFYSVEELCNKIYLENKEVFDRLV